jgi:hypothetical protein
VAAAALRRAPGVFRVRNTAQPRVCAQERVSIAQAFPAVNVRARPRRDSIVIALDCDRLNQQV